MSIYGEIGPRKTKTPQTEPLFNRDMIKNAAGGYTFKADDWVAFERFLLLGSEGGTYYTSERALTLDNAKRVLACINKDGEKAVRIIADISDSGRAVKNDPAIFALALAASAENPYTRALALGNLSRVCRIPTHLFHFLTYIQTFRGWGRGLKRAVADWYNNMPVDKLAYELVKYQSRDGWSNADALRKAHPKTADVQRNAVYKWAVDGNDEKIGGLVPEIINGFEIVKEFKGDFKSVAGYISKYNLSREMVPTEALNSVDVWEALLQKMPITALIRNLGKMSQVGLLAPLADANKLVVDKLHNEELIKKGRVHPITILMALKVYQQGHGDKGSLKWTPVQPVLDALDDAFYLAFKYLEPTGKSFLFGIDCSGSMTGGYQFRQTAGLSPATIAAAMAMACIHTEKNYHVLSFDTKVQKLPNLTTKMRLVDVLKEATGLTGGGTDCAVPHHWAITNKVHPDVIVTITDGETWAGTEHVTQALSRLRSASGKHVKSINLACTANNNSLHDPNDLGCLDVAGFDASVPAAITEFVR